MWVEAGAREDTQKQGQNPKGWLRHAGAKPREGVDYSTAKQDTSNGRDCRFDQKEECSMIGRDPVRHPVQGLSKTVRPIGRGPDTQREKVQK